MLITSLVQFTQKQHVFLICENCDEERKLFCQQRDRFVNGRVGKMVIFWEASWHIFHNLCVIVYQKVQLAP